MKRYTTHEARRLMIFQSMPDKKEGKEQCGVMLPTRNDTDNIVRDKKVTKVSIHFISCEYLDSLYCIMNTIGRISKEQYILHFNTERPYSAMSEDRLISIINIGWLQGKLKFL